MPSLETSLSTASLLPDPIHKISATYFRIHCRSTLLLGLKFLFFFSFWGFMGLWAVFKFYFSFSLLYNKPFQKLLVQTTSIYVNKPCFHHHIFPWSGWLWMFSCALGRGGGAWLLHSMSTASFNLLDAELGPARESIGIFTLSGSVSLPPDGSGGLGLPNTPVTPEVGWK